MERGRRRDRRSDLRAGSHTTGSLNSGIVSLFQKQNREIMGSLGRVLGLPGASAEHSRLLKEIEPENPQRPGFTSQCHPL